MLVAINIETASLLSSSTPTPRDELGDNSVGSPSGHGAVHRAEFTLLHLAGDLKSRHCRTAPAKDRGPRAASFSSAWRLLGMANLCEPETPTKKGFQLSKIIHNNTDIYGLSRMVAWMRGAEGLLLVGFLGPLLGSVESVDAARRDPLSRRVGHVIPLGSRESGRFHRDWGFRIFRKFLYKAPCDSSLSGRPKPVLLGSALSPCHTPAASVRFVRSDNYPKHLHTLLDSLPFFKIVLLQRSLSVGIHFP